MNELLYLVLGHLGVLLLEMSDTVSFGGEPYVAAHTKEGLLGATAVGAEMVLQGTEKLEVFAAVFTHSVRRLEILCGAGRFSHIFVVSYGCIYFLFFIFAMLLSVIKDFKMSKHLIIFKALKNINQCIFKKSLSI